MNTFKVILNPYKDSNIVSLDGNPLSPYSEITNYLKEPFLSWADKLLDAAEREINDYFSLCVVAEPFEQLFLKDLQNDNDSCVEYLTEKFTLSMPAGERYNKICSIADRYGVNVPENGCAVSVYSDVNIGLPDGTVSVSSPSDAFLCITTNPDTVQAVKGNGKTALILSPSDSSAVTPLGSAQYLWKVREERIAEILSAITDRFYRIPKIVSAASLLASVKDRMTASDIEETELLTSVDMFVSVGDIEPIEVGSSRVLSVRTVPEGSAVPDLRIVPSTAGILSVDGLTVYALDAGRTFIDIYKSGENLPFARKNVTTFRNNLVQTVKLSRCDEKMGIDLSLSLSVTLTPADADDADRVTWSTDDPSVATVDSFGTVTAHSAGIVTVTASTVRASDSVRIHVLPDIKAIHSSVTDCELFVGQTRPINITVEPSNCYDSSVTWKTSDKTVAVIQKNEEGQNVIKATGIGNCTLTCVAKGGCSMNVNVTVESTFKKREKKHTMLSVSFVCLIFAVVFTLCSFGVGAILAGIVAAITGVLAAVQNKSDRVWGILIAAIAVFLIIVSISSMA